MRALLFLSAGMLLVGGCSDEGPPPSAYLRLQDRITVALGWGETTCYVETDRGFEGFVGTDKCYRMTEPRRMRGVWIDEFEGSRFVPGARSVAEAERAEPQIWLDVETKRIAGLFDPDGPSFDARAFEVDFVGRRTLVAGQYGHLGGSDHTMIMDRLISARPLKAE